MTLINKLIAYKKSFKKFSETRNQTKTANTHTIKVGVKIAISIKVIVTVIWLVRIVTNRNILMEKNKKWRLGAEHLKAMRR